MTATSPRRRGSPEDKVGAILIWTAIGLALLLGLVTNVAVRVAGAGPVPSNPFTVTLGVLHLGVTPIPWTAGCTLVAAGFGLLLVAPAALVGWRLAHRRGGRRTKVDPAARHYATGRDLAPITRAGAARVARNIGAPTDPPGLPIARSVVGGAPLIQDWESTSVDVWGTRRGKSTARIIPAILDAPGWVVTTSSRRDTHDATRALREQAGPVWVFDPQGVVGERAGMWWNPLSFVTSGPDGPEVKAQVLADIFAASALPPESKQDAFFDPEGTELLGHLLLAAAVGGKTLLDVYLWVTNPSPTNSEAHRILETAYPLSAAAVREATRAPEKQRAGVFASAKRRVWWMIASSAHAWITPQVGRAEFQPADFVTGTGTLYLLSRGGRGSLAALTTALAAAVCEAAEQRAAHSPRGRLPVPGAVLLDEVANTCRWPDLPDRFSYYGGSGIVVMAMLQSWAQGEQLWGERGMAKLWSAANLRIYGGGSAEVGFLHNLAELAGTYRPVHVSDTSGKGGTTINRSEGKEKVLDVADLAGLPRGRILIFAGLPRPVLAVPQPWMTGPRREEIRASIRRHDPNGETTLARIDAEPTLNPEPDVPPAGAAWSTVS